MMRRQYCSQKERLSQAKKIDQGSIKLKKSIMQLFLYNADKHRYGKLLEEMENDFFQKKNRFPKSVSDMCQVLAGCENTYGSNYTHFMMLTTALPLPPHQHMSIRRAKESAASVTRQVIFHKKLITNIHDEPSAVL